VLSFNFAFKSTQWGILADNFAFLKEKSPSNKTFHKLKFREGSCPDAMMLLPKVVQSASHLQSHAISRRP